MAVQFILPPAVTRNPTVTDLVNKSSISLQSSSFPLSESTVSSKTSTTLCNEVCPEVKFTTRGSQKVTITDAATPLISAAKTFSEVSTILVDSGVTRLDHPLSKIFEILVFICSTLNTTCRALAGILRAPFLAEIVCEAPAKAVMSAAMAAEDQADSLVKNVSLLVEVTVEQIERRFRDREVPLSQSNTDQQKEFSSEEEDDDHTNISFPTPSHVQREAYESLTSKNGIVEKFGYILEDIIGYGKFSVIKAAQSKIHNCKVAVKVVTKSEVPQLYKERFLPREIRVAQILNHFNVIKFFQVIETNYCVYFIMEYADGGSLRDAIRKENINEHRARRWFGQLVEAVDYCHKVGITHRDIKCENVLLDADDNIKLTEFYFARIRGASTEEKSLSYTFCGTEEYAAPEILQHTPYDPTLSDVWSLGVVLFVIVYNNLPFTQEEVGHLRQTSNYELTFPTEPDVTASCKDLIRQMLVPENKRIDVETILQTPWLKNETEATVNEKGEVFNNQIQNHQQYSEEENDKKWQTEQQDSDEEGNIKQHTEQQNIVKEKHRQLTDINSVSGCHTSRFKSVMKSFAKTKAVRLVSKSVNSMEDKLILLKDSIKNHVLTK